MDDAVRETVLRRAPGMRSMWQDVQAKALDGTISIDEALSVAGTDAY